MSSRLQTRGCRTCAILAAALAAGCIAAVLAATASPHGTLLRNALLYEGTDLALARWQPGDAPDGYLGETLPPPGPIHYARQVALGADGRAAASDLEKGLALATYLGDNPRTGKPIRTDTARALETIKSSGRGYCADYSQVFLALAHAAGLEAREWGFGLSGFGMGHAFNEIYASELGKWVFIDAFKSFYVVDRASGIALSVLEFHERLTREAPLSSLRVVPIDAGQFAFEGEEQAVAYYARAVDYFYLFLGDNVFSYDSDPLIGAAGRVARPVEILAALLAGKQPAIAVVPTNTNEAAVAELVALRYGLFAAALVLGVLALALVWALPRCLTAEPHST